MRILVYPHAMEMGGSQLNAIEVAAAVRDRGHEVLLYADPGDLVPYARRLGLEVVERRRSPFAPSPERVVELRRLVKDRGIDVVHGYEWPPILEGYGAVQGPRSFGTAVTVGTVMSMAVADFIPESLHLVVGTERIRRSVVEQRRGPVHLMEPPVDVVANRPGAGGGNWDLPGAARATSRVVVVSRLAHELKLEGIQTAVRAVGEMAGRGRSVELLLVGDGPARAEVQEVVDRVHRELGRSVVHLAGATDDPRGAYDSADVCLAMGGSALRAMAFAKPLVVQGEGGFFSTLTPRSLDQFLDQGWYGRDELDQDGAVRRLVAELEPLLDDPLRARELGAFGRSLVVERFSLEAAAAQAEEIYCSALATRGTGAGDVWGSASRLARHKVRTRWEALRGDARRDDFNARPV